MAFIRPLFPIARLLLLTSFLVTLCAAQNASAAAPTATVINGTYQGRYLAERWDQDLFLGIPFAQPPLGELRFKWPQSLNSSFTGVRDASEYGYSCYQYGTTFNLSEDCLTLNVVRPHGTTNKSLPVLVWIYGGGLDAGSTADPQYNISGIVRNGQDSGHPFIGVSINYRLGEWGFLQSPQILAEGSSNAGLLDQRMAFRWIKENIESFGGDNSRITIWGESAGAQSIGYHLFSYGGRNDDLFHAAIMESGGPAGTAVESLSYYASPFENLTRTTNCYTATNQLACLRSLSSEALFAAHVSQTWNPLIDGDFLTAYPSQLIPTSSYIKVPLLIGANTDEGTSFSTKGVDNATAIFDALLSFRGYAITPPTANKLLSLYPNDPINEPPYSLHSNITFPSYGLQWRRDAAIGGDLVMIAQRRRMCQLYTTSGQSVYSYRFDTPLWNASISAGAQHFVNVVFSFQNISGALGPLPRYQNYKDLSTEIGRAYTSFVNYLDPNVLRGTLKAGNETRLPVWPKYDTGSPRNMVLNANGSFVEDDTFRAEGIDFINTIWREILA